MWEFWIQQPNFTIGSGLFKLQRMRAINEPIPYSQCIAHPGRNKFTLHIYQGERGQRLLFYTSQSVFRAMVHLENLYQVRRHLAGLCQDFFFSFFFPPGYNTTLPSTGRMPPPSKMSPHQILTDDRAVVWLRVPLPTPLRPHNPVQANPAQ